MKSFHKQKLSVYLEQAAWSLGFGYMFQKSAYLEKKKKVKK